MKEEFSVLSVDSEDTEVEGSQISYPLAVPILMISLLKFPGPAKTTWWFQWGEKQALSYFRCLMHILQRLGLEDCCFDSDTAWCGNTTRWFRSLFTGLTQESAVEKWEQTGQARGTCQPSWLNLLVVVSWHLVKLRWMMSGCRVFWIPLSSIIRGNGKENPKPLPEMQGFIL